MSYAILALFLVVAVADLARRRAGVRSRRAPLPPTRHARRVRVDLKG